MRKTNTEWLVKVAMLSAISVVIMLFEFPLPFIAPPFYKLDFSEVPVLIGAFALGPLAGVSIELVKVVLNLLINGTITAGVGEFANFLTGVSFILPAGLIYRRNKTKRHAVLGMTVGGLIMVTLGILINAFVLIPVYGKALEMPIDAFVKMGAAIYPAIDGLIEMVVFCVAPFNTLKVVLISAITALIYKPLSPVFKVKK